MNTGFYALGNITAIDNILKLHILLLRNRWMKNTISWNFRIINLIGILRLNEVI